MRIAIIGAGGVGGYLAAKLVAAGQEVAILARGRHLDAIRQDGITLDDRGMVSTARPALATADPGEIGRCDLAVIAVKGQDLEALLPMLAPILDGGGVALPFLNGVEAPDILALAYGEDRALIGTARISAVIDAPGRVKKVTEHAVFTFGDREGRQDQEPVPAIRAVFAEAGIDAPGHEDVRVDLWQKFVLLTPAAATTAGARTTIGQVRATPETRALYETLAAETIAVARARGIRLPDDQLAQVMATLDRLPGEMRASLAHDLAAGKRLETDWLSGAVVRLGGEAGVETPAHRTVAALLAPWREGPP